MHSRFLALILFFTLTAVAQTNKFENEIKAFEASDATNMPPKNAVLFVGSSSIRLWKTLETNLPEFKVINRGFGGSQISDANFFFDRVIAKYQPKTIVMYSGGNDINAGRTAEEVAAEFKKFAAKVREQLTNTHLAYISVAPNPARWSQIERVREANRLIEEFTRTDKNLSFINVYPHMLGADGMPKPDIFVDDRVHMNTNGYVIWTKVVGEHLAKLK